MSVDRLQVSLEPVRGGEVTEAVLTGSVGGDVIVLLTQLYMSPHVGHQPGRERKGGGERGGREDREKKERQEVKREKSERRDRGRGGKWNETITLNIVELFRKFPQKVNFCVCQIFYNRYKQLAAA